MATQSSIDVVCPDGIERRAQITSIKNGTVRLSVRQGGTRYAGVLVAGNQFKAVTGENGNVWQWLNVRHPSLMPSA